MTKLEEEQPGEPAPGVGDHRPQRDREQAIEQIQRRRRFWRTTGLSAVGMVVLTIIWATSEYHNASGWPTAGFSQSSGGLHEWNYWILYPAAAWVFITAAHAWSVWANKPISESEIEREISRRSSRR